MLYYKIFFKERKLFDVRFIFDCYVIAHSEISGILLSDKAIQNNLENIFTHRFLHFMVEDQIYEEHSDYLPFIALIKAPDYKELFKTNKGQDLYQTLTQKFGKYNREPYKTPRDQDRSIYFENIIKKHYDLINKKKEKFK